MSLEIRSIGEVISYQTTPRIEFVVGIGIVKSKTNEDENITFNHPICSNRCRSTLLCRIVSSKRHYLFPRDCYKCRFINTNNECHLLSLEKDFPKSIIHPSRFYVRYSNWYDFWETEYYRNDRFFRCESFSIC